MQVRNLIPRNARNSSFTINANRIEYREITRLEYLTWINHFFSHRLDDAAIITKLGKLTFKDLETAMLLYIRANDAKQAQETREEEARQKALLDKLKAGR